MLEQSLSELFRQQASETPPALRASIDAAAGRGRTQLRRRRLAAVGTPLLAAIAVLAVAVATALSRPAAPPRPAQHGKLPQSLPAAPRQFNPLVPYVAFGWLPPGARTTVATYGRTFAYLSVAGPHSDFWQLAVYARGDCAIRAGRLQCRDVSSRQAAFVGRNGPVIDGRRAHWYWSSDLIFEYASGGWARLTKLGQPSHPGRLLATAAHMARTLRLGGPAAPVRFPAQFSRLPAGWAVRVVISTDSRTGPLAFGYEIARGSELNEPWTSSNDIPQITIRPAGQNPAGCYATPGRSQQIEVAGRQVTVTRLPAGAEPAEQDLCAVSAVGLAVDIVTSGNQPPIDVTTLFAHLRPLGPNPRKWTTTPFG